MARVRALALVATLVLAVTGTALGATIVGTARGDVLRGTAKADRLYGGRGNDRLLGLGGNDVLYGGPGADRLVCGAGRDTAVADERDAIAKDCEVVRGVRRPPLPVPVGTYCGSTAQGLPLCLAVGVGVMPGERVVGRIQLAIQADCEPAHQFERSFEVESARTVVRAGGSFVAHAIVAGFESRVEGRLDAARKSAVGSLSVQFTEERDAVRYACDSGAVAWSAGTPAPSVPAPVGTFCGSTSQELGLCFDVAGTFKTVTNLRLLVRTECLPPATFGLSATIPTAYAIAESGQFAFRRRGDGTTPAGGSFVYEQSMNGAFDASGASASGTVSVQLTYDAPDGTRYDCRSGDVAWTAASLNPRVSTLRRGPHRLAA